MTTTLEAVRSKIQSATSYVDVFGSLPDGDGERRKKALKQQYRYLAKTLHPDQAAPTDKEIATQVFTDLSLLYQKANNAIEDGSYHRRFTAGDTTVAETTTTISVGARVYTVSTTPHAAGDFSNIYLGTDAVGKKVLVKVAADPTYNQYLAQEAMILKSSQKNPRMKDVIRFIPELLDSLLLTEAGNEQFRVNVFRYVPGLYSLREIRDSYPNGLDCEDAMWISRRILAQTLAANMMQSVHGAIVPDHVLVNPLSREPLHIGWVHAVEKPYERQTRITTVIERWRDWYPPEVFAREIPTHQTDLYMAGKTIVYLLGGDVARNRFPSHVPMDIQKLIGRLLERNPDKRPSDGLAYLREFTKAAHAHWGKNYRPLLLS